MKPILMVLTIIVIALYLNKTPLTRHYNNNEFIPNTEEMEIRELIDIAFVRYDRIRNKNDPIYRRDQHSKSHGCVKAKFDLLPNLPKELQIGLFDLSKKSHSYDAWIRFSNAAFGMDPDTEKDGRGLSLKLLNVPGNKLVDMKNHISSQDFILMNHPVFLIRDVSDYLLMGKLGEEEGDQRLKFFFPTLNPFDWRIKDGLTALSILSTPPNSPVNTDYFSVSAYKLGEDNYVKYAMKRCQVKEYENNYDDDGDLMRKNLNDILAKDSICYLFMVQKQKENWYMPIEDLTVEWSEQVSPFIPVAQVIISKQQFDNQAQNDFCENMNFNPWNTTSEHEPVGGLNRSRKVIYEAIARHRRMKNGVIEN